MDEAVRRLCADHPAVAAVAVGGYGRRQLCIHSDIDLMLVVGSDDQPIPPVFRALWDAGLSVGHSVRTVAAIQQAARDRFETACSLLDARPICGDPQLIEDTNRTTRRLVRPRQVRAKLAGEEQERRRRTPHHLQAVDIKAGRGGLRCLQAVRWLIQLGEVTDERLPAELDRHETELLELRQALHAVGGRATERADVSLRTPAARWLGTTEDAFLARLLRSTRGVDRLAALTFGSDLDETEPATGVTIGRRAQLSTRSLRRIDRAEPANPWLAAAALLRAPRSSIDARLDAVPPAAPAWTDAGREAFLQIAGAGPAGRRLFDALQRTGHLERLVPEWPRVISLPQSDPFHLHPVDDHLWRTAAEVVALASDDDDPWTHEIADELGTLDDLILASLFHDIGKGTGRDHSEAGAEIAAGFAERAGFDAVTIDVVSRLVRDHLLLPRIATRHDLNDPDVIADVAARVGDPDVLRMLFLLTIADARATGPEVATPWRSSLIRTLFVRAIEALETAHIGPQPLKTARIDEISRALTGETAATDIAAHLAGMPDSYVLRTPTGEVRRHLLLLDPIPASGEVRIDAIADDHWTDVVVVTADRPGLLAITSGVMALSNISIIEARLTTRRDGAVVDQFLVVDSLTRRPVDAERWTAVLTNLRAALAGTLDLDQRLLTKHRDYSDLVDDTIVPEVRLHPATPRTPARLELRCADRIGLLHDVARVLHRLAVDVRYAKIDTQGGRVIDTFHILRDDLPAAELERAVLAAATAAPST